VLDADRERAVLDVVEPGRREERGELPLARARLLRGLVARVRVDLRSRRRQKGDSGAGAARRWSHTQAATIPPARGDATHLARAPATGSAS
jgi:hypothetical protein